MNCLRSSYDLWTMSSLTKAIQQYMGIAGVHQTPVRGMDSRPHSPTSVTDNRWHRMALASLPARLSSRKSMKRRTGHTPLWLELRMEWDWVSHRTRLGAIL